MAGPVRRRLARLIYRVVAGSPLPEDPAPPAVTPKPRAEQPDEVPGERLADVRVAYQEVLDATKHQDDKIGRFMAGIAFLIAGALVFTNSTVLQATYLVGDTSLPLPALALALGAFLILIVLSLLFYLLAMSAPLTIPPAARTTERSRQYFLVIAGETHKTWRRLWTQPASSGELRAELADENVDEIRNLAAGCFRAILVPRRAHGTIDPGVAERRGLSWLVMLLAIAAGALAVSAILLDRPVEQLGIGLVVAISPLAANLFAGTIKLNQRLLRHVG
jgi:hypothetical protein